MKALVIDDDAVSRMAMEDLLNQLDTLEIVEAEDGEMAWQHLEQGLRPLLCCCDVNMPRLSGIELLKRVKAHPETADIPFVLISSASDRDTVAQAIQLGIAGYILKPLHAKNASERLSGILKSIHESCAEKPAATIDRLNISPARLSAYLATLSTQLGSAPAEIKELRQQEKPEEIGALIDRLHTGCTTLGLWRAAALLKSLAVEQGASPADNTDQLFGDVIHAVTYQTRRLKKN